VPGLKQLNFLKGEPWCLSLYRSPADAGVHSNNWVLLGKMRTRGYL
jgi:hypothetical protein